jgi:hypothetical protein
MLLTIGAVSICTRQAAAQTGGESDIVFVNQALTGSPVVQYPVVEGAADVDVPNPLSIPLQGIFLRPGYVLFEEPGQTPRIASDYLGSVTGASLHFFSQEALPAIFDGLPRLGTLVENGQFQSVGEFFIGPGLNPFPNDYIKVFSALDVVPEPNTLLIAIIGVIGLSGFGRRR